MMLDMIEELRMHGQEYEVCNEAADEIERLRRQVADWETASDFSMLDISNAKDMTISINNYYATLNKWLNDEADNV